MSVYVLLFVLCVCVYEYVLLCVLCACVYVYVYVRVYVHVCVCECICACMCVRVYVLCMSVGTTVRIAQVQKCYKTRLPKVLIIITLNILRRSLWTLMIGFNSRLDGVLL